MKLNRMIFTMIFGLFFAWGSDLHAQAADNLGDHKATQTLNMDVKQVLNVDYAKFKGGQGNGVTFWNLNANFRIMMGNQAEYKYGPVQDYSIKTTMNNDAQGDRGWTWGVSGLTPVAAISTHGKMQLSSDFTTLGQLLVGTDTKPNIDPVTTPAFGAFIADGLLTEEVRIQLTPWPDYVFADDYQLMSLEETQAFINENGHLPSTPSAEEIDQSGGLDLGTHLVNQQEKIEELFLHLIEAQKKFDAVKAENVQLKERAIALK